MAVDKREEESGGRFSAGPAMATLLIVSLLVASPAWAARANGDPPAGSGTSAQAAGSETTQGYGFFWQADVAGFGSYRTWAADIDADGIAELIVDAFQGESEGGGAVPEKIAIYDRFTKVYGGDAPAGGIAQAADVNGDRRAELLTWREEAYAWNAKTSTLEKTEALTAALAEWERTNYFPAPSEGDHVLDVDGDGTLDYVEINATSLTVRSKTKGTTTITLDPSLGEVAYPGHLEVVDLGREEKALFVETVTFGAPPSATAPNGIAVHWTLWHGSPAEGYSIFAGMPDPKRAQGEFQHEPQPFFADLDGDDYDEFVTSDVGTILIYHWSVDGYVPGWRSADNGGLGYASFMAADMNANGVPELVARHVTPDVYHNDLKVYELRGGQLEGLADVKDIGAYGEGFEIWADFLGLGTEQIIMGREWEMCRPSGFGLGVDLDNLPAPLPGGLVGRLSRWYRSARSWLGRVRRESTPGRLALDAVVGIVVATVIMGVARLVRNKRVGRSGGKLGRPKQP